MILFFGVGVSGICTRSVDDIVILRFGDLLVIALIAGYSHNGIIIACIYGSVIVVLGDTVHIMSAVCADIINRDTVVCNDLVSRYGVKNVCDAVSFLQSSECR